MIESRTYLRKSFPVEAVQVTAENMAEVAEWCMGELTPIENPRPGEPDQYIQIDVLNARTKRQTQAHVSDWVLKAGMGFKSYTDRAFMNAFEPTDPIERLKQNLMGETVEEFREELKEVVSEMVLEEKEKLEVPTLPANAKLFLVAGEAPVISEDASAVRRMVAVKPVCPDAAHHTNEEGSEFLDAQGHPITPERWLEITMEQ